MLSANLSDGLDSESSRMFHAASPASYLPGLRPTRGSGDGAPGAGVCAASDAAARVARASELKRARRCMEFLEAGLSGVAEKKANGVGRRGVAPRLSGPSGGGTAKPIG